MLISGWIPLALAAHLAWALANIGDKYAISNKIKNPYVYQVWMVFLGATTLVLIPFIDFKLPNLATTLWLLLAGALYFFGGFPYVKAVQKEDISRVNIWWGLIPVFSLFLAWWTIGDRLNSRELLALLILLTGAFLASLHIKKTSVRFSKIVWLMVLAAFAYAAYATILRHVTLSMSFVSAFVYLHILMLPFALIMLLFTKFRKSFRQELKNLDSGLSGVVLSVYLSDRVGILFNIWALSLGPVALVYALEGFQAIFVFLLVIMISLFTSIDLQEELDRKNVILKVVALAFMVMGVALINL